MCVNSADNIYKRSGPNGRWEQMSGAAVQIDVWDRNTCAVANRAHEIYVWQNGAWVKQAGAAKHVNIGALNYQKMTCCNSMNEIYQLGRANNSMNSMNSTNSMNSMNQTSYPTGSSMGMGSSTMGHQHHHHPHQHQQHPHQHQQQSGISVNFGPTGISVTTGSPSCGGGSSLCPSCSGKGGYGAFGYCGQGDVHYRGTCNTCHGSSYISGTPQRCVPCDGKGHIGAFGPCTIWDVHKRSTCNACGGKGYRF
jgi:hypothetical protein